MLLAGLLGVVIGRRIAAPLSAVSPNSFTVASLGLMLVLMEAARLLSNTQELWLPPFLNQVVNILPRPMPEATLTLLQLLNSGAALILLLSATTLVKATQWGRNWRAVCQDRLAAELCGVNSRAIYTQAYAASALLAGAGGVLATMHYGTMGFGAGLIFGLKIVLISAVGGHHHPLRAVLGAAAFGFAETCWSAFGPIIWRDAAMTSLFDSLARHHASRTGYGLSHLSRALSSASLAATQPPAQPFARCSFFQNGAAVFRKSITKFAPSKAA